MHAHAHISVSSFVSSPSVFCVVVGMLASDVEYREDTFTACSCSVLAPTGLTAFCELAILSLGSVTSIHCFWKTTEIYRT